jgi:hypothetical protein
MISYKINEKAGEQTPVKLGADNVGYKKRLTHELIHNDYSQAADD